MDLIGTESSHMAAECMLSLASGGACKLMREAVPNKTTYLALAATRAVHQLQQLSVILD